MLTIDLATHLTESWAAVGAVVWSGNRDPERAFVSVYHPQSRVWSPAHQVDIGPAQLGRYSRTVAVAISGDRTVHAVRGMSDPDFRDNDPPSGIWAGSSTDFGTTWSPPQRIASDCRRVNDLAVTLDGTLVAQLICNDGPDRSVPAMVVRWPDGAWRSWGPVERIATPQRAGEQIAFVAPAYDPAADRLVAVWTCCAFVLFATPETTHYASWSVPGSGVWQPGVDATRVPLVFGARSAFETVSAQARNSRSGWIAWIERQQRVELRSFTLNQIVPVDQYQLPGGRP